MTDTKDPEVVEKTFLGIFRYAVLIGMSLALLGFVILVPMAAYNLLQSPKEITPPQPAPAKSIELEDLKKYLIDQSKKAEESSAPKQGAPAESARTLPYDQQVRAAFRCVEDLTTKAGITMDLTAAETNAQIERIRSEVERAADRKDRGEDWVTNMQTFVCKAMNDPALIELRKTGKVEKVFFPTINFHMSAWDALKAEKARFEAKERARFVQETDAEERRVAAAKAKALALGTTAGALFAAFMVLALYLIFSKIERNLRVLTVGLRVTRVE